MWDTRVHAVSPEYPPSRKYFNTRGTPRIVSNTRPRARYVDTATPRSVDASKMVSERG
jgi:hypothetical protein